MMWLILLLLQATAPVLDNAYVSVTKNAAPCAQASERCGDRIVSLFSGVPTSLPALLASYRLTQKAAGVGFDWPDAAPVLDKAEEEIEELREALAKGERDAVREEVGDLLFTIANLARKLEVDPEAALAGTNRKFRQRFARIEEGLAAQGRTAAEASLEEMDALWEEAKRET